MTWLEFELLLFALSWAGVGSLQWYAVKKGLFEKPSKFSNHTSVTPSGGGIIFSTLWVGLLVVLYYYQVLKLEYLWLFLPGIVLSELAKERLLPEPHRSNSIV